jgi:hypothetical protein
VVLPSCEPPPASFGAWRSPRHALAADDFAAIPERPKHHTRFHRIAARIRVEESKLVGHLGGVAHDLERRARLRGMLPK